jgi:hypothetical protein
LDLFFLRRSLLLIVSIASVATVVLLRLGALSSGVVYFNSIARRTTSDEYVTELVALTDSGRAAAVVQHCQEIAKICEKVLKKKGDRLTCAMFSVHSNRGTG